MSKRTIRGIDLTAPGGVRALMDFHRLTFGDAVMEDGADAAATAAAAAQEAADNAAADAAAGEKLGEGGIKALQAERDARASAEKELAELRAEKQAIEDGKLSDIEKANKAAADAAAELATMRTDNARLTALATHPVPAAYQHLVHGTDAASFEASAKAISELAAAAAGKPLKPEPIPSSGGGGGGGGGGSSVDAGRDLWAAEHNKTNS